MDARELERLLSAALQHKGAEQFLRNITFVISYLKSEQEKRQQLEQKLTNHSQRLDQFDKDMMGTKNSIDKIEASSKANNRMLRAILTAVVSGIIMEAIKFYLHK